MPSAVLSIISWQKWFGACLGINNMIICRGISISQLCRTRGEWQWLGSSSTARAPVRGIDPPGKLCYQTWNCHYWEHLSYILHHIICNIRIYFDIYIYIYILLYTRRDPKQTSVKSFTLWILSLVSGHFNADMSCLQSIGLWRSRHTTYEFHICDHPVTVTHQSASVILDSAGVGAFGHLR